MADALAAACLRRQAEAALDSSVRPLLAQHGGDIAVASLEGGILRVKMLGGCAGCPSAEAEIEALAADAVKQAVPEIKAVRVETGVSDELLDAARQILSRH
jgi:Fe/S biogenesis protein NfuA